MPLNSPLKRVGLFGGSFDPVHAGHLRAARAACETLGLEQLVFIPSSSPPHKPDAIRVNGRQRCEMLRLATCEDARFSISEIELQRGGKSFTVDTVRQVALDYPQARLFFLLGDDCTRNLHRWKGIAELLRIVQFVSVSRIGATPDSSLDTQILSLQIPISSVSSTQLRATLAYADPDQSLLPTTVLDYIRRHRLYESTATV